MKNLDMEDHILYYSILMIFFDSTGVLNSEFKFAMQALCCRSHVPSLSALLIL
jgi:hypothetical protein